MRYFTILTRSLRLRCPRCGVGKLFRRGFTMHERCSACGLKYERAPGFYLGSVYVNYGVTALLLIVGYVPLYISGWVAPRTLLWIGVAFSVLFPLAFFRHARSLWLGFDQFYDPQPIDQREE